MARASLLLVSTVVVVDDVGASLEARRPSALRRVSSSMSIATCSDFSKYNNIPCPCDPSCEGSLPEYCTYLAPVTLAVKAACLSIVRTLPL